MIPAMEWVGFLRGMILGFSIAAPVGPIGILCIRRTLAHGRSVGFSTGLGAASADAVYGWIAGAGLSLISAWLIGAQFWIRLLGGVFLLYLGGRMILARPVEDGQSGIAAEKADVGGAYFSALALTLSNPATILMFVGVFAGIQPAGVGGSVLPLISGVFCGSLSWWCLLTCCVGIFRRRLSTRAMLWINRSSGGLIILFGLAAIVSLVTGG